MRVAYTPELDVAYVFLKNEVRESEVSVQVACDCRGPVREGVAAGVGAVVLDFTDGGVLVGLEVTGASRRLPREVLDGAHVLRAAVDDRTGASGARKRGRRKV